LRVNEFGWATATGNRCRHLLFVCNFLILQGTLYLIQTISIPLCSFFLFWLFSLLAHTKINKGNPRKRQFLLTYIYLFFQLLERLLFGGRHLWNWSWPRTTAQYILRLKVRSLSEVFYLKLNIIFLFKIYSSRSLRCKITS
jgi:hypothetical protein